MPLVVKYPGDLFLGFTCKEIPGRLGTRWRLVPKETGRYPQAEIGKEIDWEKKSDNGNLSSV